ncbi:hypothetical protein Clacol_005746 [Clathrus columnatus]|uniref:N-acetyltransferase domain-containing protein n=1 Tax=Clathrus columnatus TaxID=1419009 RepID=A0AAV5AEG3_9AGAM|nr:hypothetical protein Clacol_005746 [Clathrus columnatus]
MTRDKESDDEEWNPLLRYVIEVGRRSKRIRLNHSKRTEVGGRLSTPPPKDIYWTTFSETPLPEADKFDDFLPKETCLLARQNYLRENSERDRYNNQIRMLTLSEIHELENWLENCIATGKQDWTSGKAILHRRLELRKVKKENPVFSYDMLCQPDPRPNDLQPCSTIPLSEPNKETLDILHAIRKTPYEHSFAYRILGNIGPIGHIIFRDWQTRTIWMDLMDDIKLHYVLAHPENECTMEQNNPIDYVTLEPWHLPQLHDLLSRTFWSGIDGKAITTHLHQLTHILRKVSSSLDYSPEKCTVIALYKRLVVGAAFLSSPLETYLTYLAVRPGWEFSGVASTILYLLLKANPTKDITLHVSANNPAMLLYNKFGFKAEEFIVGFYDEYLPRESQVCKNAFRLRLRR